MNSGNKAKTQNQSNESQKLPIAQGKTKPGYWPQGMGAEWQHQQSEDSVRFPSRVIYLETS